MKYTASKYQIFAGKIVIGNLYLGGTLKGNNELRIKQGMDRTKTIEKIIEDCPEFTLEYGLTKDYYPKLF